jgi:hypothetical protein
MEHIQTRTVNSAIVGFMSSGFGGSGVSSVNVPTLSQPLRTGFPLERCKSIIKNLHHYPEAMYCNITFVPKMYEIFPNRQVQFGNPVHVAVDSLDMGLDRL